MKEIKELPISTKKWSTVIFKGILVYVSMEHEPVIFKDGKYYQLTAPVVDDENLDYFLTTKTDETGERLYIAMELTMPELQ